MNNTKTNHNSRSLLRRWDNDESAHLAQVEEALALMTQHATQARMERDELLAVMEQIHARAIFMLTRNPQDNQADYIMQQSRRAIADCEKGKV